MGEYRLTQNADDDLLNMFIYGFETFGLAQAEEYREGMIYALNCLLIRRGLAARPINFHLERGGTNTPGM